MDDFRIEPLDRSHELAKFSCGRPPLDDFPHLFVTQYEKRKLGRTFVAVREDCRSVVGYYTLASGSIAFEHLPAKQAKKLPKHPVPVALLGRLAVDLTTRGQGLGEALLMDALKRCLTLSQQIGIHAVEVLAIDDAAARFYVKYGFVPLADNEMHLFLPMRTVEQAHSGQGK
jgi:predicted GNAT family N-acyltransferase